MWRRRRLSVPSELLARSDPRPSPIDFTLELFHPLLPHRSMARSPMSNRQISTASGNVTSLKRVENIMPIATGHEREELQAELEETPSVIKSFYGKRIVGCPGAEGVDEHDVVWFWLEKGKPHECPEPNHDDILDPDAAAVWRDNMKMFESNVRKAMAGGQFGTEFLQSLYIAFGGIVSQFLKSVDIVDDFN